MTEAACNMSERVLPLQCEAAHCIIKYRVPHDILPKRMQEFIALHDPKMVRFVLFKTKSCHLQIPDFVKERNFQLERPRFI